SAGCATWNELARATLAEFQVAGEVDAVSSAELGAPALRPRNGCLESSRTQALRPWQEALAAWATTRGANQPTKASKRLGPGDLWTQAPSLAAGGEVVCN